MESSSSNGSKVPLPASRRPLHATDADEEDENVKQLNECAAIYLSLQDCLIKSNRNWKECQARGQATLQMLVADGDGHFSKSSESLIAMMFLCYSVLHKFTEQQ